jgi:hypothetical protein
MGMAIRASIEERPERDERSRGALLRAKVTIVRGTDFDATPEGDFRHAEAGRRKIGFDG